MPLLARCIEGGGRVAADIQVSHGTAAIGVLDGKGESPLTSVSVAKSDKMQTIFLRLNSFCRCR